MTDYNRQTVLQKPSRFITECPADLYEIWNLEEEHQAVGVGQLSPADNGGYIN